MRNKKHIIFDLFTLLSVVVFGLSASPVHASNNSRTAQVLGFVSSCSENIPFANVTATCGTQTLSTQTGSTGGDNGKYSITFNNTSCKRGSTVSVTSNGFTNSGTIGTYFWFTDIAEVNIQTGSDCSGGNVPEFGAITGILTLLGSGGVFQLLRKKD